MRPLVLMAVLAGVTTVGGTALHAQVLGQGGSDPVSTWRVVGALALCLTLAVLGAFVLRARPDLRWIRSRVKHGERPSRLETLETIRLNPQTHLWLIRCDQRHFLLMSAPHGTAIQELADGSSSPSLGGSA